MLQKRKGREKTPPVECVWCGAVAGPVTHNMDNCPFSISELHSYTANKNWESRTVFHIESGETVSLQY